MGQVFDGTGKIIIFTGTKGNADEITRILRSERYVPFNDDTNCVTICVQYYT